MMTSLTPVRPMTPSWSLLKPSYELARKHLTNVIFLILLPSLLLTLGSTLLGDDPFKHPEIGDARLQSGAALMFAGLLLTIINQGPTLVMAIQAVRGKELTLRECYQKGLLFFWRIVGLGLLAVVVVGLGLVLFVVPGVVALYFILKRYFMTPYYMVDKKLSIKEALAMSHERTEPYFGFILGVVGVQVALSLIAGVIGSIHIIVSVLLSLFVASVTVFLPVLRYQEIEAKPSAGSVKN